MLGATRVAVGTGSLQQDDAKQITREWERRADGNRRRRAVKAPPASLEAMGIKVVQVPKRAEGLRVIDG